MVVDRQTIGDKWSAGGTRTFLGTHTEDPNTQSLLPTPKRHAHVVPEMRSDAAQAIVESVAGAQHRELRQHLRTLV